MTGAAYYLNRLSGERLRRCYELAPQRIKQYLDAEILYVVGRVQSAASVLELGCGYGRALLQLARTPRSVVGIDTSLDSLLLARDVTAGCAECELAAMDATALGFRDRVFDAVVCIQNGICAFRVDPHKLLEEAIRVTRPGGQLLFSSYAEAFWPHRLHWFQLQAAAGLVGKIDYSATTPGEIVCEDGFRSGTTRASDFARLCDRLGVQNIAIEVDGSSLVCEITAPGARCCMT